jgi:antitoxin component YwqK of YwqJK toxin-antitoxin module
MESIEPKKVKLYYPGMETLWKKYYILPDGVKHGDFRMYWRNEERKVRCFYVHGALDGSYKEYYSSGEPWLLITYKAGVRDGPYRQWYENGQLEIETHYRDGMEDGPYHEWTPAGRLITDIPAGHPNLNMED